MRNGFVVAWVVVGVMGAGCAGSPGPARTSEGLRLEVLPAELVFDARPGDAAGAQTLPLRLANTGDGPLRVEDVAWHPAPTAGFVLGAPAMPFVLGPGEEVSLEVAFEPAAATVAPATLRVRTDHPGLDREVPVRTGAGPRPRLACSPDALALATVPPAPAIRRLACRNDGNVPATITAVEAGGLALELLGSLPVTLAPGASLDPFLVTWEPNAPASLDAEVRFRLEGGLEHVVPVTGEAGGQACAHGVVNTVQNGPPVDVLFVVHDAHSLAGEMDTVVATAVGLTQRMLDRGVSFHVGVASAGYTYTGQGYAYGMLQGTPRVVDNRTPSPVQSVFANASVDLFSSYKLGLRGALDAVTEPRASGEHAGFLRPDARLEIVFLADAEDDSSFDASYYATALSIVKEDPSMVRAHALVGGAPTPCGGAAESGSRYAEVAHALGGTVGSICDAQAGEGLSWIADFAGRDRFALAPGVHPDSVRVRVGGETRPFSEWRLGEDGWIDFEEHAIPPAGAAVRVDYDHGCPN